MKKLTFENAVLIIFIMIILISTSETTSKYITMVLKKEPALHTTSTSDRNTVFPTLLTTADNLFKEGNYADAANEYFTLTLNNALSTDQKIFAYFRLGICQYNLGKYDLALNSFINVTNFNKKDSVAYNNAAVSAYKARDIQKAIELQQKALDILPNVEYYYNLGGMYENNEQYDLALDNYLIVTTGEQNITRTERIDPIRVKSKVAKLASISQAKINNIEKNVFIALKSYDTREILIIDENGIKLKPGSFTVEVENQKNTKNIVAQYDKKKLDPYGLITELLWTVYKDGRLIYKKASDKINISAKDGGNYEVKLNIKYNGNQEIIKTKTIAIETNQSTINDAKGDEVVVKPPIKEDMKYNIYSIYEQLFEDDFKISRSGYADKYNVVWGIDRGIETSHSKLAVDKASSLVVKNTSDKDAGLWVNLDSLLLNENIKDKTIWISFHTRKITENAKIYVSAHVKTNNIIVTTKESFIVPFKFQQNSIKVYIPPNASGLTVSIKTIANEEFNIDAFTIID